ncbi:nuclear RNA export factor 2-like [Echinops telfairi]|uniref:Nuclear RNA export factor 2-like n=1 Tax=Echinops telfairi TaxID=9371 RepID=A0AC55D4Q7_ECHTE|nr:nuclear RNA export factor 2-like [Echinops telfairi]
MGLLLSSHSGMIFSTKWASSDFSFALIFNSDIRDLFSKLLNLNDQELPSPVFSDIGDDKKLPLCKGSVFGSETLKNLLCNFLKQYYSIYDDGDRQSLLSAYHDNACFSLSTPFNPEEPSLIRLGQYSTYSRNMKQLMDVGLCVQLLKHTKWEVVNFLCVLPKTQHDFSSFVVDTCVQTEKMLCFSVGGKFKEVQEMCETCICTFNRNFILTTVSDSSICIINDQLTVTDMSPEETQSAFMPVSTPSSTLVPTTSKEQQEVQQATSIGSACD